MGLERNPRTCSCCAGALPLSYSAAPLKSSFTSLGWWLHEPLVPPGTWEVGLAWSTLRVPGQLGLHSETLFQKKIDRHKIVLHELDFFSWGFGDGTQGFRHAKQCFSVRCTPAVFSASFYGFFLLYAVVFLE